MEVRQHWATAQESIHLNSSTHVQSSCSNNVSQWTSSILETTMPNSPCALTYAIQSGCHHTHTHTVTISGSSSLDWLPAVEHACYANSLRNTINSGVTRQLPVFPCTVTRELYHSTRKPYTFRCRPCGTCDGHLDSFHTLFSSTGQVLVQQSLWYATNPAYNVIMHGSWIPSTCGPGSTKGGQGLSTCNPSLKLWHIQVFMVVLVFEEYFYSGRRCWPLW